LAFFTYIVQKNLYLVTQTKVIAPKAPLVHAVFI